ncbi:MAG: molecular chaperone TorD family protein [Actinomycetota bacterium]
MSRADLLRGLGALCERPGPETARLTEALELPAPGDPADETATFLFDVYPFASVYLGDEGMLGGEARDRIAGFWRALGLVPPAEPDHLASLLGLLASLADLEDREDDPAKRLLRREARCALLWEHLLAWTGPFLAAVERVGTDHQVAWAGAVRAALAAEADDLGRPDLLPVALRAAAPPPADAAGVLAVATAPVRTGIVLTRTDVVRGARAVGVGIRMGERAYALRAMAEQDLRATVAWLGEEAARQAVIHGVGPVDADAVAGWWLARAERTARTITEEVTAHVAG